MKRIDSLDYYNDTDTYDHSDYIRAPIPEGAQCSREGLYYKAIQKGSKLLVMRYTCNEWRLVRDRTAKDLHFYKKVKLK